MPKVLSCHLIQRVTIREVTQTSTLYCLFYILLKTYARIIIHHPIIPLIIPGKTLTKSRFCHYTIRSFAVLINHENHNSQKIFVDCSVNPNSLIDQNIFLNANVKHVVSFLENNLFVAMEMNFQNNSVISFMV